MKKTFKNIRTLAALLIASAAFSACSNEDSAIISEQPASEQQAPQVYTLTIDASMDGGAQTRALELDGTKLVAKWAEGDELTVFNDNKGATLGGTLTASNVSADGKKCTFSGTLTGTISPDDNLVLFYHNTMSPQNGTLASAAANDRASATVKVATVDAGNITITGGTATFNTVTTILKLTLKDGSSNALNATSLTISVDGVNFISASPTAATYTANGNGVLYFVVPCKHDLAAQMSSSDLSAVATWETNLETYPVTFTATVGSDTYTATKSGYKLDRGKYYATTLTMAKAATSKELSAVTTSEIGWRIGSDGKAYSPTGTLPTGVTAVAMIAYVNGSNGLAIQLSSSPESKNWAEAKTYAGGLNTSTPIAGGTWRLPSKEDWQNMFVGCAVSGDANASDFMDPIAGFKAKIAATGITWQSCYYWSSTPSDSDGHAWYVDFHLDGSDAYADFHEGVTSNPYAVLGCLAFTVEQGSATARALAEATAEDLGKIVGADGNIYDDAAAATTAGTTAVAMIAYVGSDAETSTTYNHGLALALEDVSESKAWCSQKSATCLTKQYSSATDAKGDMAGIANTDALCSLASHTHAAAKAARDYSVTRPAGTSEWFLPSAGQWDKMATAAGGYAKLKTNAGLQSRYYWSSSECNASDAWVFDAEFGDLNLDDKDDDIYVRVRACLAF